MKNEKVIPDPELNEGSSNEEVITFVPNAELEEGRDLVKIQDEIVKDSLDLTNLEATAAGGAEVGGGSSLSTMNFEQAGNESSVSKDSSYYNGYTESFANISNANKAMGGGATTLTLKVK